MRRVAKRFLLPACFFLSGSAGLVYEVLWTRILALSFGHTVWAVTTVLAAFMGGVALGSFAFGKAADRSANPVRMYAVLELGIGLYCLACPYFLEGARHVHRAAIPLIGESLPARTGLQFLLANLVLVVPTALMGGTVPAMAKAFIPEPSDAGRRFGLLYGVNTLGAALGAFAAGYWLLPSFGIRATNAAAAVANISIGAALLLSRAVPLAEPERGLPPREDPSGPGLPSHPPPERLLRWACGITGCAAMIFQVAWVRSLVLVIGSSTYAYSAILVTVLLGIAVGGTVCAGFRRTGPGVAAAITAGTALSAFLLLPFFGVLPGLFLSLFAGYDGGYAYIQFVQFLVVFPVILVPSILMGMSLPCIAGMVLRDGSRIGGDVGRCYAWNTGGAIAGSVLAGFVLIPAVGSQNAVAVGVALELALAAAFLSRIRPAWRNGACAAAVALGAAAVAVPSWDRGVMNMSAAVYPDYPGKPESYRTRSRGWSEALLFDREGISTNVAVFGRMDGTRWFTVNGKTDGGTGDMLTQVRLAMLPMVLHPGARRVAILGLGTGVTAATAGLFEGVRSIDIVELEPSVAEVARFFERENGGILSDPRTRLRIDDGRSHFGSRRGEYDVVISEPSNPWISGVANLYTVESFREIRESLAPGGVFGLWVQLHGISLDAYRLIARTALAVFPDATLWQVSPGDTLIICGKGGEGERDVAALGARLRGNPRLSAALGERGEVPLEPLVTSYLLGTPELRRFAGPGDLNTDDRNILEFTAPRSVYRQELNRILREVVRWKEPRLPPFLRLPETDTVAFHLRTGEMHNLEGNVALALWEFRMAPSLAPRQAAGGEGGPGKVPAAGAAEDFEGPTAWHFLPIAGTERPEDGDEEASLDWQADIAHLTRTSGVVRGSGRGGGHGLSLKGARISPGGYAVPLESDPSAEYEVGCWLKYDTGENGSAGIAVSEYNTVGGSGIQPTAAFERRHLVRRTIPFHRKGKQEWAPVSFRFRTSPGTVMVSVLFFIDADRDGRAFFDDIRVARVGPP